MSNLNSNLNAAKKAKDDEFYTQLSDIEKELVHYRDHFRGKVVYCNCDDPAWSNFWKYFHDNFKALELKGLKATHYVANSTTMSITEYDGETVTTTERPGNGDFRYTGDILEAADIVCTNPPFSLFKEYVAQLVEYGKKFLIMGNLNAITYKNVFPLIKDNRMWLGTHTGSMAFHVPADSEPRATRYWVDETGQKWRSLGNVCWFTNLDHAKRHEPLNCIEKYSPDKYPTYDNYDAIEVAKVLDIPYDYDGVMGVPITFLDKYDPDQFEIIWVSDRGGDGYLDGLFKIGSKHKQCVCSGKILYTRILIRRKK